MTSAIFNDRVGRVTDALAQQAGRLEAAGNFLWRFQPRAAASCSVVATLDENWLVLAVCDLPAWRADTVPWNLLQRNATLPGFAKFALAPGGSLQLRAELPLLEDADLAEQIRATCAGFEAACAFYDFSEPASAPEPPVEKLHLKDLCTAAGWPFIERGPDKLLIELETPGQFWQAVLVRAGCGVHLSCELGPVVSPAAESRDAIAQFLLSASGVLRLARAAVSVGAARLEVAFVAPPRAAEISSALESLSVGVQLCGEELKTLQDPAIARRFLELRGASTGALA